LHEREQGAGRIDAEDDEADRRVEQGRTGRTERHEQVEMEVAVAAAFDLAKDDFGAGERPVDGGARRGRRGR
jgi:hypothetical protein